MTRNSIALMRDGSVMADSDLVDFLSGPTDSAINFNGSADLHTPIHPPPDVPNIFPFTRFQITKIRKYSMRELQNRFSRQPIGISKKPHTLL